MAIKQRYSNFNVKYTASARGRKCNSIVLSLLPAGTLLDIFLFHGSPDIMLQASPIEVEEVTYNGCIETKEYKKSLYQSSSMIPEETGQLIAYIHQMICNRKILKGEECMSIKGVGLYVARKGKCILFDVYLSADFLKVNACTYCPIDSPVASLCKALTELTQLLY